MTPDQQCAVIDCPEQATVRLTYPGHAYPLCDHHADRGLAWLHRERPHWATDAVATPLPVAAEQPPLFGL